MYLSRKADSHFLLYYRVIVLLTLGFGVKFLVSCIPCSEYDFDYNSAHLTPFNNFYIDHALSKDTTSFYPEAIAFKMTVEDSIYNYYDYGCLFKEIFDFPTVQATSPCYHYNPKRKLVDVKFYTDYDINSDLTAGSDISDYVLLDSYSHGRLYIESSYLPSFMNRTQGSYQFVLDLFIKPKVENESFRMKVKMEFEDGSILEVSTPEIKIRQE